MNNLDVLEQNLRAALEAARAAMSDLKGTEAAHTAGKQLEIGTIPAIERLLEDEKALGAVPGLKRASAGVLKDRGEAPVAEKPKGNIRLPFRG